jgi:hypothetical protein
MPMIIPDTKDTTTCHTTTVPVLLSLSTLLGLEAAVSPKHRVSETSGNRHQLKLY